MKGQIHRSGPLLQAGLDLYKASFPRIWPLALLAALLEALPELTFASAEKGWAVMALAFGASLVALWPYGALLWLLDEGRYRDHGVRLGVRSYESGPDL